MDQRLRCQLRSNPELRHVLLRNPDFVAKLTGKGHWKITDPKTGLSFIAPATPKGQRAGRALRSWVRRIERGAS